MPSFKLNSPAFILLFSAIVIFSTYYFFFRDDRGPLYYFDKIFSRPHDSITESYQYRDLTEEYQQLNRRIANKRVIVFWGDSITKRFNVYEYFPDKPILNRGIYSDTTEGMLYRMRTNISDLNIDKLFILIGYNDLQFRSDNMILDNISTIITRVKAKVTFIQSILPVAPKRVATNARIRNINKQLEAMCLQRPCIYVDLHSYFLNAGGEGLSFKYSYDGIHPNAEGNRLWARLIEPYVTSQ